MAVIGEMKRLTIGGKTYTISGGVDSVQVQATSPVQSSISTAQTGTASTTISLADAYGDTKNPYGTKTANYVLAGPTSGTAAAPTFRKLVAADIPDLSGTYLTTYTDEKLKWTAATATGTYYPIQSTSTATTSTANTLNGIDFYQYYSTSGGYRRLDLGNTTVYTSTGGAYGTIRLYGAAATYYGDLIPGTIGTASNDGHLTANRTWTFPNASGIVSLQGDNISLFNNDAGYITIDSDENVKSTTVTAATTNYIVGSTTSTTTTGGLSKHASAVMYTTADSGTSGYTQLRLGNTTATSSAGGKEGQIRLYGTTATYYVDLKAGAPSTNRTITFPNATGTVALTSDIPDVSGFITSANDKDTTYALSGSLSSHKFTSTLTASGSGSGTTTSEITFAAGTGITLSDSGSTITIASSVTNTDEKVTTAALTSGTTYYPILATGTGTATRQIDSTLGGLKYVSTAGTTSAIGTSTLYLGNSTASGTANNEQGVLRIYGTTAYYTDIKAESGLPAANRTIYLPSYAGTMYLTCTSTTNAVGNSTTPVYVDNTGKITVCDSIPYSFITGTPTIPVDTNTTYSLSGGLSSHTFTVTLTPSEGNATTASLTLAEGEGITLSDSGSTITISSNNSGSGSVTTWYGTCSTTASTAAKVVTCADFALTTGAIIGVLFSTGNTAATPTLNVNSTTAKTIYVGGNTALSSTTNVLKWSANTMVYFMYDGTYFRYITSVSAASVTPSRGANTWYGTSSTGATTAAKTSTIDNYVLTQGAVVSITFSTANTYSSGAITLNVNSTGAKTIYYKNAATSSTNLLPWDAGETLTFIYSGSYYYFVTKTKALEAAATTAYTTANVKNIIESTDAPGTTTAPTGTVWLQYGAEPPSDRADYVVEQGTTGIWTYRKWNSGIAECWGTSEVSNLAITTTWGNLKYGTLSAISFPSSFFTAVPNLTIFLRSTSGRVWATQTTNMSSSTTGTIYAIAPESYTAGSTTIYVVMTAIGTWK